MSNVLTSLETNLLGHLFGAHFGSAIQHWVTGEVQAALQKNGAATLAEIQATVNSAVPVLVGHLTALVPPFLRPFVTDLEAYAEQAADGFIADEFARLAVQPASA